MCDKVAEPDLGQPTVHRFDGGALVTDQQHRPALRRERSDEVGDGLGLAGTGRPVDRQVGAGEHSAEHGFLRGVRCQHAVGFGQPGGVGLRRHCADRVQRVRVTAERIQHRVTGSVLVHQVTDEVGLAEVEGADDLATLDLEAGHRGARSA